MVCKSNSFGTIKVAMFTTYVTAVPNAIGKLNAKLGEVSILLMRSARELMRSTSSRVKECPSPIIELICSWYTVTTLLLQNGVDIRIVQEFLGHASIATTQRYTHISKEHLIAVLQKAIHR